MKKLYFLVLLSSLFAFTSCSDDDGDTTTESNYQTEFSQSFPDATDVVWTTNDQGYNIVSFKMPFTTKSTEPVSAQAWYNDLSTNFLTEEYISTSADEIEDYKEASAERYADVSGYSNISLAGATRGTCKGNVFYKLFYSATSDSDSSNGVTWLYVYSNGVEVDFYEYKYDFSLVKTEMPELYAMEYIESKYSNYCLTRSAYNDSYNGEDDDDCYCVPLAHSGSNGGELYFMDWKTDVVYDEQFCDYDRFNSTDCSSFYNSAVASKIASKISEDDCTVDWLVIYLKNQVITSYEVEYSSEGGGIGAEYIEYDTNGTEIE